MTADAPESRLARWSRLKRREAVSPTPEADELPAALVQEQEPPLEIPPDARTIPLEDITAWLGKRVPDGWREAALRRVWSADTAIRDFVGPADYAWDWNTPGGAPGWGPIGAADDLVRALARAIGEDLPRLDVPAEAEAPAAIAEIAEPVEPEALPAEPAPPAIAVTPPAPPPPTPRRGGRAAPV